MDSSSLICRVCRSAGPHPVYRARELMHGTRDEFDYVECRSCKSVQIVEPPAAKAMSRYYPTDYYSFQPRRKHGVVQWLLTQRDRYILGLPNIAGAPIARVRSEPVIAVLSRAGLDPEKRILDVGCGAGLLLDRLAKAGFQRLMGVDPYIGADLRTPSGVAIKKQHLDQVTDVFDIIMFNHSLEHVADPTATLVEARKRLAPDGVCLVRIPTPSSEAWDVYHTDWVQLDAPRHIVLPSRHGMAIMAGHAGLGLDEVIDDSGVFQFTGSEMYKRDIPLHDPKRTSLFQADELRRFADRAAELNAAHRGDQALFVLRNKL